MARPKQAGFFDEVDGTGIVEDHIQQVLGLEKDQADQILKDYSTIRRELVDRLSRAPKGSFTAQHLRGVLAQVSGAITAINKHLAGATIQGAYQAALKGVNHLIKEINVFDDKFTGAITPINLNAALVAHDVANLLTTKYKTNLDLYGKNLEAKITNGLFSATLGETSYDEVVGRVANFFTGEEWQVHRIVRTELHNVYNTGKLAGMRKSVDDDIIPDLKKTLMHAMDDRTGDDSKYAARLALVAEVDEPFKYSWPLTGKNRRERVFMAPPDRPNDRAILVPYREAWGSMRGPAFVPGSFQGA